MNPEAIKQLQKNLGIPVTGILDESTISSMNKAVEKSVSSNKTITSLTKADPNAISNAYMTGNWSGITGPTGKPFTKKDQQDAFAQAEKALAPGFKAQETYDTANVEDVLKNQVDEYGRFLKAEGEDFRDQKMSLDKDAADRGVLFSGSRVQKNNELRKTFQDRQAEAAGVAGRNIANTSRDFQYRYGDEGASNLSKYFNINSGNSYNPNVATNGVRSSMNLSSVYNPSKYDFQGTTVNSNKANTQVRAAGLLANRANKLLGTYNK